MEHGHKKKDRHPTDTGRAVCSDMRTPDGDNVTNVDQVTPIAKYLTDTRTAASIATRVADAVTHFAHIAKATTLVNIPARINARFFCGVNAIGDIERLAHAACVKNRVAAGSASRNTGSTADKIWNDIYVATETIKHRTDRDSYPTNLSAYASDLSARLTHVASLAADLADITSAAVATHDTYTKTDIRRGLVARAALRAANDAATARAAASRAAEFVASIHTSRISPKRTSAG